MAHPLGEGRWYKCKGCGVPCAIFPNGEIAHGKPDQFLGIPNRVQCALYHRCETRAFFMQYMAGEPLDSPTSFEPVTD
jgi:hypothetical protein